MRLVKARVQNYRSVLDTGEFEIEQFKTILVGPNEAGKTVILKALQQLKKPRDVKAFDVLRDYPRSKYSDIRRKIVAPEDVTVVTGYFDLDEHDKKLIPAEFHNCQYKTSQKIDNTGYHSLENAPAKTIYRDIKVDMARFIAHIDRKNSHEDSDTTKPGAELTELISDWPDDYEISIDDGNKLQKILEATITAVEEGNSKEEERLSKLQKMAVFNKWHGEVLRILDAQMPTFVLFNNYFKVKPSIHLEHLAQRIKNNLLDDDAYDYGNVCLLKLLGFTARELADLGNTESPNSDDQKALQEYKDKLDERSYQLNAASVQLTYEIRKVWMPNPNRPEADKLKVVADGQYLKVVVEDALGVEIELDQRSEGFQWLVSFFVVFFAEATDKHQNAILLLDEPGTSLHGLKQRDFRETISKLAEKNQVIFTTHSPFLVGPDELDIVRVVEMRDRSIGTKVTLTLSSSDPAGLLPLQEALGYDLAQSLFAQQRNLVLEGLTDYWYLDTTSQLLSDAGLEGINEKTALVFANSAGKLVYYATILHAHNLKVAALLDSDAAGDQAATQENLVHTLGNKNILRTKDYVTDIAKAEIEDLLRETLIPIANIAFGVDCSAIATSQPNRPIIDIFNKEISDFSKYKLAKAYIRWTKDKSASDLAKGEVEQWKKLFHAINKALK